MRRFSPLVDFRRDADIARQVDASRVGIGVGVGDVFVDFRLYGR